ncbi:MAG: decarboxylating 6-phosphogluconate dehydrogenase [Nitrospinota bacterium]|nr:decarboxylating 6-phosphogluconate dehydrogenase [Nitrospinota bacterium]
MNIGFVGLGKMGGSMVERLLLGGHGVVVYDRSEEAMSRAVSKGAEGVASLNDLAARLPDRKVIWLMVPSGRPVDDSMDALMQILNPGDILIDGGNSYWRETQQRSQRVSDAGMHWIDCGTSGGVWGLDNGYCLMYGGNRKACDYVEPVFQTLAPPRGARYVGPSGAGHFVKMVHNAIEYGMMQAYAEGFEIMENSPFEIDLHEISQLWQEGSVVRSWLLELTERALGEDPGLSQVQGYVEDSGEGRWAVQSAIDFDTPAPVITMSLFARFQSRRKDSFAMKLLAALRNQFGGHAVKKR